jgi:maleamate amidohydrolase
MPVYPWDDVLTDQDREVIRRGGYGQQRGLGTSPALLIIDCQYNHIGGDAPILEQIDEHPAGGGEGAWRAVHNIEPVLARVREMGAPVIYTRYCFTERGARFDAFAAKRGKNLSRFLDGSPGTRIVEPLTPRDDELVIDKVHASAFYATALLSALVRLRVDSLLVVGVSTSGCVRATVVDAVSNNFNVAVLQDCVADRIELSHKASLLDLWMKYADVMPSADALEYLHGLAERMSASRPVAAAARGL